MPLGDSITHGFGGQVSYRRALWFKLVDGGYAVDFVGSHATFAGTVSPGLQNFDLDHEGHSGWEAGELDASLEGFLQGYDADIALVHAGTNDLIRGQDIASTLSELGGIIDKLRADNPYIIILLAKIIPGVNFDTGPFNAQLETWALSQDSVNSPVVVIDQADGYNPVVDNFDNLHPNSLGEEKMATRWYAGIQSVLTAGNQKPLVDAGANLLIDSISEIVSLNGGATDDGLPLGATLTYEWTQIAGPGTATFVDPTQPQTNVSFSQSGGYELRFIASDSEITGKDEILIQVGQIDGLAGYWPLDETAGSAVQDVSSNGNNGTLINADDSNWQPGVYNNGLCLDGLSGQQVLIPNASNGLQPASVTIAGWVKPNPSNGAWAWVAGQGDNAGIYVTGDSVSFYYHHNSGWRSITAASTAVRDGQWHHLAGSFDASTGTLAIVLDGNLLNTTSYPNAIVYSNGTAFSIGSMQGTRNFKGCLDEIKVYDRALSTLEVQLISQTNADPVNQPPTVNAGDDQTIQLPVDTIQINAQLDDDGLPDGSTLGYSWIQQSGPGTASFTEVGFSGGVLTTDITLDTPGVYVLVLEGDDGELINADDIQITLLSEGPINQMPTVDAGADQVIQLPVDTVQITAQLSDDGLPEASMLSYAWSQLSGPGTAIFTDTGLNSGTLTTDITLDLPGVYVVELEASDGELSGADDIEISLLTEQQPPTESPVLIGVSGFWRLDELSGLDAANSVDSLDDGTLINLDSSHWQPGVYNNGLCLDGQSGQQVSIPVASSGLQPESVTVTGWVKPDPTSIQWAWVAGHGDNYGLFVDTDEIFFYFYNGAQWRSVSFDNTSVRDGQWHHLAGSFNAISSIIAVYMDGALLNSASFAGPIIYSRGNGASIGSMQGQRNFKGCLDEIQVYGRALSNLEIQTLARPPGVSGGSGKPVVEPINTIGITDVALLPRHPPVFHWRAAPQPGVQPGPVIPIPAEKTN